MSKALELIEALNGTTHNQVKFQPVKTKALAWARVSTDMQAERGSSMDEQLKQIREYAEKHDIEIVAEYFEAASAYQQNSKRLEFHKMLDHAQEDPEISTILIHDFSRFSRDSTKAKTLVRELKEQGIKIISLNDPDFDSDTAAGVYMEAFTFAKNEAFSRDVAFHTRKGCKANVNARDQQTGWCYKNGGLPLWGYKTVRLERGQERKGVPIIKAIWELDDTIVAGRPVHEWVRYCLVELAMKGASLAGIRDFLNQQNIPPRKNKHWSLSSVKSLLTPPVLLEFSGYGVWNVRRKNGQFKPDNEWEIVENAHPAIISEDEVRQIAETRQKMSREKRFDTGFGSSRKSQYLLSGGLFKCNNCGSNMVGYVKAKGQQYYLCGSRLYRRGLGCGHGVYVPKDEIEQEVIVGITDLIGKFQSTDGFTRKVNRELSRLWEDKTGVNRNVEKELKGIETKIENLYKAIEGGLAFDSPTKERLSKLNTRKVEIERMTVVSTKAPYIDFKAVSNFCQRFDKVFGSSVFEDRKKMVRECVDRITLAPDECEVEIHYKVPPQVVNCSLASPRYHVGIVGPGACLDFFYLLSLWIIVSLHHG